MSAKTIPSYRQVRRGLLRLIGGPGHVNRLYGNPGYRRLLSAARKQTIDPGLASAIVAQERRCTPWTATYGAVPADLATDAR